MITAHWCSGIEGNASVAPSRMDASGFRDRRLPSAVPSPLRRTGDCRRTVLNPWRHDEIRGVARLCNRPSCWRNPVSRSAFRGFERDFLTPRGNLMLTYGAVARRYRPRWLVWENVPGVLSSHKGRDFGTFLGCWQNSVWFAYRVLDAQYVRTRFEGCSSAAPSCSLSDILRLATSRWSAL